MIATPDHPDWIRLKNEVLKTDSNFERYDAIEQALCKESEKRKPDFGLLASLREAESAYRLKCSKADPLFDLTHNFYLPNREGKKVLFNPYSVQKTIIDKWIEHRTRGVPLRLLIPKSRRHGISQIISALMYRHVRSLQNQYALVLAHEDPAAKEIFNKYRFYHAFDPFAPEEERSSVREMQFAQPCGGNISVRTAGTHKAGLGHGFGFHVFHASEVGLYEGVDPYMLLAGVLTAMPSANTAWTAAIYESTGHGMVGPFPDLCIETWNDPEASEWDIEFFNWPRRDDAWRNFCDHSRRKNCPCDQNKILADKWLDKLGPDEKFILDSYGEEVNVYQLHWWSYVFRNEIKASSMAERRRKMRQEHPMEKMDCFQATGGNTFDIDTINILIPKCKKPEIGKLTAKTRLWDPVSHERVRHTPDPKWRRHDSGPLSVWSKPQAGHHYSLGVDLSQGAVLGDYHAGFVFNRSTRKPAALYRVRGISPISVIEPIRLLSKWYNDAIICPEVNFFPHFTEILANTDRERFLYWRKDQSRTAAGMPFQKAYGWRTTINSKRNLVSIIQDKLENEPEALLVRELLDEMVIFKEEVSEAGNVRYPGAVGEKHHDDIVIAAGLAFFCDLDMGMVQRLEDDRDDAIKAKQRKSPAERWKASMEAIEEQKAISQVWTGDDEWDY